MCGFVEDQLMLSSDAASSAYCGVMDMQDPSNVPVMSFLANEFAVLDQFFASVPGSTWPNRLFALTATSAGVTETGYWYEDVVGQLFQQPSIFDQLTEAGFSWKNYYNDTPWVRFFTRRA